MSRCSFGECLKEWAKTSFAIEITEFSEKKLKGLRGLSRRTPGQVCGLAHGIGHSLDGNELFLQGHEFSHIFGSTPPWSLVKNQVQDFGAQMDLQISGGSTATILQPFDVAN